MNKKGPSKILLFIYNWSFGLWWMLGIFSLSAIFILAGGALLVVPRMNILRNVISIFFWGGKIGLDLMPVGALYIAVCIFLASYYYRRNVYHQWSEMSLRTQSLRKYMTRHVAKAMNVSFDITPDVQKDIVHAKMFNKFLKYNYVDYHSEKIRVWIRIPDNDEVVEILDEMKKRLLNAIKRKNPEFSFSDFDTVGNYLIAEGTKIKSLKIS
ncbi:hypothetical protein [Lactobacillus gasseri]|uniref:hypothetical protein n=1 Tax=Lactobacillus gasseri TaxID=1596 RepID=UPI00119718F4|nr:hypothetical protein [Lactobacillus gasseri]TVU93492.1 hypothetical protein FOF75_02540 [Lactobacillus gasseri]TVV14785.1 hypothetical protein FOF66_07135 [Lactobacillus gasseri]